MERLTFDGNYCDIAQCRELLCPYDGSCTQKEVWERLKAYEDSRLSPQACAEAREIEEALSSYDYSISRMVELMKADKDGRVVVLPCKVGDTVWALIGYAREPRECKVEFVNIGNGYTTIILCTADDARKQYGVSLPAFGRTVFFTREEAEKALQEMEGRI